MVGSCPLRAGHPHRAELQAAAWVEAGHDGRRRTEVLEAARLHLSGHAQSDVGGIGEGPRQAPARAPRRPGAWALLRSSGERAATRRREAASRHRRAHPCGRQDGTRTARVVWAVM